jgi:hypothetical protein
MLNALTRDCQLNWPRWMPAWTCVRALAHHQTTVRWGCAARLSCSQYHHTNGLIFCSKTSPFVLTASRRPSTTPQDNSHKVSDSCIPFPSNPPHRLGHPTFSFCAPPSCINLHGARLYGRSITAGNMIPMRDLPIGSSPHPLGWAFSLHCECATHYIHCSSWSCQDR